MKKIALGLLICLLVFVSCDSSGPKSPVATVVESDTTPVGLKDLPEDDVKAITSIGTVTGVYGEEVSKFVNGQEIHGFTDAEGNAMTLKFTSKLVSYSKLNPEILAYVSSLETANAKMHHGYNGVKWNSNDIYVEYATYRFEGNKDQKRNSNICFIEIRIFQGDFREQYEGGKQYYAKSVLFDSELKYDLNRKIEISTGKRLEKHDPYTNSVTYEKEKVYRTVSADFFDSVINLFPVKSDNVFADRDKNGNLIVSDYQNVKFSDANGLVSIVLVMDKEDIEKGSKCADFIDSLLKLEPDGKFMTFSGNPVYNFETQYIMNIYFLLDNQDGIVRIGTRLMTDGTVDKAKNYYASSFSCGKIDDLINRLK